MKFGKKNRKFLILSSEKDLALARNLSERLNIPTADVNIKKINGSESVIDLKSYVTQKNIYIVYNIRQPVSEDIMKILLIVDALKREGAKYINLMIPYMPYTKSPIDLKYITNTNLIVRLFEEVGVDTVYTFDLYSKLITSAFKIPVYNVSIHRVFAKVLEENFKGKKDMKVVTIDYELQKKAKDIANDLDCEFTFINANKDDQLRFELKDSVNNKNILVISNTIDRGKILVKLSKFLALKGARNIYILATHGLFRENAIKLIEDSIIKKVFVATADRHKISKKIKVISKINILTELIQRTIERKNIKNFIK